MVHLNVRYHPLKGVYKTLNISSTSNEKLDIYGVVALAKRLNINLDELKNMSFVSLANILISTIEKSDSRVATQKDIDNFLR